jgi:hypothetical protein
MPRKPRQPPMMLHIERISDGQRANVVDDFTGEAIAQAESKPLPTAFELDNARHRARLASKRALLETVGLLTPREAKLVAPAREGMRPVATLAGHAIYVRKPSWRRV